MFSSIFGFGYNIFMSFMVAYLLTDVMEGSVMALPVAFTVFILFIAPTSLRIQQPDHRFDWLKYF